jgi:hypothetical protein
MANHERQFARKLVAGSAAPARAHPAVFWFAAANWTRLSTATSSTSPGWKFPVQGCYENQIESER